LVVNLNIFSVLQTLNQRPQGLSGMQPMQNKMPPDIGMGPGPQVGFVEILLDVTKSL
jgi:hypothetical protein